MKKSILLDGRVLRHGNISGVERYTMELRKRISCDVAMPPCENRYCQHLWEHLLLPMSARRYGLLFSPANMCPAFKPHGVRYVTTIHDVSFLNYPDSFSVAYRNYYRAMLGRIICNSDAIITVSFFEKRELEARFKSVEGKVHVIYNGVGEEFLNYDRAARKGEYILYAGTLSRRKNIEGLMRAFSMVYKQLGVKLVVVGSTPEIMKTKREFRKLVENIPSEYIEFKGHINDSRELARLYGEALFFVFPSLYESFGLPALEAMACGCAVIASNTAALPEICGEACLYVNPFDAGDIARKMVALYRNESLRRALEDAGRRRAKDFSWEKSAKNHIKLFGSLINL